MNLWRDLLQDGQTAANLYSIKDTAAFLQEIRRVTSEQHVRTSLFNLTSYHGGMWPGHWDCAV